jgi:hypothetical protein
LGFEPPLLADNQHLKAARDGIGTKRSYTSSFCEVDPMKVGYEIDLAGGGINGKSPGAFLCG